MSDILEQYMKDKVLEVSLPSNPEIKFKIKKISSRTCFIEYKNTLLYSNIDIKHLPEDFKDLTDKQKIKANEEYVKSFKDEQVKAGRIFNDKVLVEHVIEPKISMERKDGFLFIDDILDDDYNFLVNRIKGLGEKGATDLKPFRKESNTNNTRPNGKKIQPTAN